PSQGLTFEFLHGSLPMVAQLTLSHARSPRYQSPLSTALPNRLVMRTLSFFPRGSTLTPMSDWYMARSARLILRSQFVCRWVAVLTSDPYSKFVGSVFAST